MSGLVALNQDTTIIDTEAIPVARKPTIRVSAVRGRCRREGIESGS
jgi:hypothetical protein